MVGCIILTYIIKRLERGGWNGGTQVLDDLEHEDMGVRRWRRKVWAWWDQVTTLYIGVGS